MNTKTRLFSSIVFFSISLFASPVLKGLMFYGECVKDFSSDLDFCGIRTCGISIPGSSCFCQEMETFLGKPINQVSLQEIKASISKHYRCRGYPLVVVVAPDGQDITNGVLSFVIIEGKLGKVSACGACYFDNECIKKFITSTPGCVIDQNRMLHDLMWINRNSFRTTNIVYEPGDELGYTNVVLETCDRFPVKIWGGYENTGNIIAGNSRYYAGVDFYNPYFKEDTIRYLFITAPQSSRWYAHTATYTMPFSWRHILEVRGSFSRAVPDTDDTIESSG